VARARPIPTQPRETPATFRRIAFRPQVTQAAGITWAYGPGEWPEYTVNVAATGYYDFAMCGCAYLRLVPHRDRRPERHGSKSIGSTGGWQGGQP
jgi:hypothetical protein